MPDVVRIKTLEEKEIDTVLADDIDFEGTLSFEKPLMVKGKFKGEIRASGDLYVGDNAIIEAKVMANLVSIKGTVKGDIQAKSQVELFASAVVTGDIETPNLEIERGSQLNGSCKMTKKEPGNADQKNQQSNSIPNHQNANFNNAKNFGSGNQSQIQNQQIPANNNSVSNDKNKGF
jgi:cytoskeletal protein CcmA (bactofilin family)